MKIYTDKVEKWYPFVLGVTVLSVLYAYKPEIKPKPEVLFGAFVSIFTVIFGFFLTVLTIVKSFEGKKGIQLLRKYNKYDTFLSYLIKPMRWSLYISVLSLTGIIFPPVFEWNHYLLLYLLIGLAVYVLAMSIRFIHLLILLYK